eukprot:SAG11_NODE_2475_length_3316_cov_2.668635_3_plen_363_part_00
MVSTPLVDYLATLGPEFLCYAPMFSENGFTSLEELLVRQAAAHHFKLHRRYRRQKAHGAFLSFSDCPLGQPAGLRTYGAGAAGGLPKRPLEHTFDSIIVSAMHGASILSTVKRSIAGRRQEVGVRKMRQRKQLLLDLRRRHAAAKSTTATTDPPVVDLVGSQPREPIPPAGSTRPLPSSIAGGRAVPELGSLAAALRTRPRMTTLKRMCEPGIAASAKRIAAAPLAPSVAWGPGLVKAAEGQAKEPPALPAVPISVGVGRALPTRWAVEKLSGVVLALWCAAVFGAHWLNGTVVRRVISAAGCTEAAAVCDGLYVCGLLGSGGAGGPRCGWGTATKLHGTAYFLWEKPIATNRSFGPRGWCI